MRVYLGPYQTDRVEEIEIHDYDTWNADHTIALIALPIIQKLKESTHGSPFVDNNDVPEDLRAPIDFDYDSGDIDEKHHERWQWVLSEIIFGLEHVLDEGWEIKYHGKDKLDIDGHTKEFNRMQNGLQLFGKYFSALWS